MCPNLIGSSFGHDHSSPPVGFEVGPITRTHTHKYIIANKVTKTKTHRFNITIRISAVRNRTHKYHIRNSVELIKVHRFNVGGRIKKNRTHKWNRIAKITKTHTHKYTIRIKVTKTKTHKYLVVGKLVRTHIHKWNQAGHLYDNVVKTHKYNVVARALQTQTHKWNILTPQITEANLEYYLSSSTNSLGGAINLSAPITDNTTGNIFDAVTGTEASNGETEYRCVYVKNISTRSTMANAKIWLETQSSSPYSVISIGLGTSAIGGAEQTIANEEAVPSGVTFQETTGVASALSIGSTLAYGQHKAIWLKRVISAGSPAYIGDNFVIGFGGDTYASE